MKTKGMLSVVVVAATLALSAGCKGSEEAPKTDTPPPPPAEPTSIGATPAATTDVATYPTEVAVGGTVMTQQNIKVYQAADPSSTVLTTLGPNTLVETKTRYGDWTKINWPSGVGKLSPGWCQSVYLGAVRTPVVVDAGVDSGTPAPSASASASSIPTPNPSATPTASASASTSTGPIIKPRPVIGLPTKKK